jgi:hypothetical protein
LVGAKDDTAVAVSSYWDTETTGQMASPVGDGFTTEDMFKESTYDSWDFVETWMMEEDVSYPSLMWQMDK